MPGGTLEQRKTRLRDWQVIFEGRLEAWNEERHKPKGGDPVRRHDLWENFLIARDKRREAQKAVDDYNPLHISAEWFAKIKDQEGYEPRFAPDPIGIPTIGYGHVQEEGEPDDWHLTEHEASVLLRKDLERRFEGPLRDALRRFRIERYSQGFFDACIGFLFNLGVGKLEKQSTFGRALYLYGRGKVSKHAIAEAILTPKYATADGHSLPGLVTRRHDEARRLMT